jgi:UDP-3-O-[3-hydroxymyristoyl] N-acetylglucosamine deacetylase
LSRGVGISTLAHLLSALNALGIDKAYDDLDKFAVPIRDGSALPYTEAIREAGIVQLAAPRN